jgi:hypothetical protein
MAIKPSVIGNIVKEYKFGKTVIKMSDAGYINRTPEEIEATLERIGDIAWKAMVDAKAKGKIPQSK